MLTATSLARFANRHFHFLEIGVHRRDDGRAVRPAHRRPAHPGDAVRVRGGAGAAGRIGREHDRDKGDLQSLLLDDRVTQGIGHGGARAGVFYAGPVQHPQRGLQPDRPEVHHVVVAEGHKIGSSPDELVDDRRRRHRDGLGLRVAGVRQHHFEVEIGDIGAARDLEQRLERGVPDFREPLEPDRVAGGGQDDVVPRRLGEFSDTRPPLPVQRTLLCGLAKAGGGKDGRG
jgi:hypothetical protein